MWEKPGPGHWDRYRCMEGLGQEQWGRDTEGTQSQGKGTGTWSTGTGTQVTRMWEDQDRGIEDTENSRGTWTRTEGYQGQDKDTGDWD